MTNKKILLQIVSLYKIFLTSKTPKCDFSKNIHLNKKKTKNGCIENQKTFKIIYHLTPTAI